MYRFIINHILLIQDSTKVTLDSSSQCARTVLVAFEILEAKSIVSAGNTDIKFFPVLVSVDRLIWNQYSTK
jgi:hypothetical protein